MFCLSLPPPPIMMSPGPLIISIPQQCRHPQNPAAALFTLPHFPAFKFRSKCGPHNTVNRDYIGKNASKHLYYAAKVLNSLISLWRGRPGAHITLSSTAQMLFSEF